jgi:integrase
VRRQISTKVAETDNPSASAIAPWVLHDIRRTVASGMARLGVNLPVIEKVLNHVSGSFAGIVGVYQRHTFADEKRRALEDWGRHVDSVVNRARGV